MSRVKVTINKKGYIPNLGNGPFRRPILITKELYSQLVKLGYPVKVIESNTRKEPIKKVEVSNDAKMVVTEIVKEEEPKQDVVTVDTVEVQNEEPAVNESVVEETDIEEKVLTDEENEEEIVEEILVDDPDLSAEAFYNESFLSSKVMCKKILSARQVQYEDNASFSLLKKLVVGSNPEVELEEEVVEE